MHRSCKLHRGVLTDTRTAPSALRACQKNYVCCLVPVGEGALAKIAKENAANVRYRKKRDRQVCLSLLHITFLFLFLFVGGVAFASVLFSQTKHYISTICICPQ